MYTCDSCTIHACKLDPEKKNMPKNCPMRQEALVEEARAEYQKPEINRFFVTSSVLEHDGYCSASDPMLRTWSTTTSAPGYCA